MPGESDFTQALIEAVRDNPETSARGLARILIASGTSCSKTVVNSVLYSRSDLFHNDGAVPPNWSLSQQPIPTIDRAPHRVAAVAMENLKAFDSLSTNFGGITLIYGENSTGKSTILQGLLLMKQSWLNGHFLFEGPNGSFGHYTNIIHGHDPDRRLSLSAYWLSPEGDDLWSINLSADDELVEIPESWHPISAMYLTAGPTRLLMTRTVSDVDPDEWAREDGELDGWESGVDNRDGPWGLYRVTSPSPTDRDIARGMVVIKADADGFPDPSQVRLRPNGPDSDTHEIEETLALAEQVIAGATEMFEALEHVPPYRPVPARDSSLGAVIEGQSFLLALLANEDDELIPDVNEWLAKFAIPYEVSVVRNDPVDDANPGAGDLDLQLTRIGGTGETVHLVDVGFGISQLLPLIAQLIGTSETTILIEEPEAHVHPRHQSVLADLFLASMQDWGNTLIVETHSEPILLRLQRRIAEERLDADEVKVLHVQREETTSTITEVPILDNGQLDYVWPGGFFDDRMDDLVAILDPRPPQS